MKPMLLICLFSGGPLFARAEIIEFDLSPPGTGTGVGLHPRNEVIPGLSNGSGNEVGAGISFDTTSRLLTLNLAYGSAFGFTDLTGPSFSWLLHGPSPLDATAPVVFNLESFHKFAPNPARGGWIFGNVTLDNTQGNDLLAGLDYINIYTPGNLGGELRGQLVAVPEPTVTALLLAIGVPALLWRVLEDRQRARS